MKKILTNKRTDAKWPILLRVYGELAESLDFPIPGVPISPKIRSSQTTAKSNKTLRPITLHYKIREPSNSYSNKIRQYDALFRPYYIKRLRKDRQKLTKRDIKNYLKLIEKACKEEISKAHIIFCTCTNSAAKKFQKCTYWKQVCLNSFSLKH